MLATLAVMSVTLAGCNPATLGSDNRGDDVMDKVGRLDLSPRYPKQVMPEQSPAARRARAEIYGGNDDARGARDARAEVPAANALPIQEVAAHSQAVGNGFELNFENTPIATVAKVVLGDILGVGYSIDPRLQGTVSLSSVRPVPKSDVVYVLENALRLSGTALVRDGSGYRLIPLGEAAGAGTVDSSGGSTEAGYGITALPLQYVSAPTLLKLLDSFALKPGMVRADPGRNLLLIQGTGAERRTAVDAALSFDADWMRGQSVGIFPITNGNPEPIVAELEKIMDTGDSGLGQNMVKFQTVSRMNAVMVISRKPALLHTAETWIKRLDAGNTLRNSVHVYRVKYGEARQMARVLNEMFTGNASSADVSSTDLAPGSGAMSTSSSERLSAASTTGQSSGSFSGQPGNNGLVANRGFGGAPPPTQVAADAGAEPRTSGAGGKPLMDGVRITPDIVNNTLLIYADRENYRIIEATLRQCDRPQLQVAIDATIAEVTLNDNLNYGVQAFLTSKNLGLRPDQGSLLNTSSTSAPATVASAAGTITNAFLNRAFPGFNFLIGSESQPSAILSALHTVTDVKVLSNPSLVVIDNQAATLQVGDQVPVSTGSATVLTTNNTVVNTIDYRNTGIILRVAPRVNENGNVRLEVEQEISNVSPQTANSLTPTVAQRKVKSSVAVASGQTVLLAGLISETHQGTRNGVPGIDQIPGLGELFSNNDRSRGRTELIIFIRPQIIRDGTDAHYVAEELRSKLRGTIRPVSTSALQTSRASR
ncbi:Putative general secretion pathway protein D [Bradyrhizobium sp. ORS 285]|uniref:type II secretion system secretin GspD n=1 Tax=Bradyrhizobium sp. ORS 285 TaxID=115808 RepID=UPI0002D3B2D3|nr:type II secretion system secretin GspD [Bradyrhizobium sp. ORS 285]SMX56281.1 Putative general secretion pathway protein D [Bradyrhizobium sp. ORS 285]